MGSYRTVDHCWWCGEELNDDSLLIPYMVCCPECGRWQQMVIFRRHDEGAIPDSSGSVSGGGLVS